MTMFRMMCPAIVLLCVVWLASGCGGAVCGDGAREGAEQCDDGNLDDGDGCSSVCLLQEICDDNADNDGNGVVDCADDQCADHPWCAGLCTTPQVVDLPLTAEPSIIEGTTTGSPDFALSTCQMEFNGFDGPDVAYLVTPQNEYLRVVLSSEFDHGLEIRSACADQNTSLACADAFFGGFEEFIDDLEVTPGAPLYVIVGAFSAADHGPFTLSLSSRARVCGDALLEGDEQCDDGNTQAGDGCDAGCLFELVCGDGYVASIDRGGNEQCDDGNTSPGDGCDDTCQVEAIAEIEPNDDGTPEIGGVGADGNDFDPSAAHGPLTDDVIISAALEPAGDEDVFLVQNTGAYNASVRLDIFMPGLGVGVSCGAGMDTVITVRDAAGQLLDRNVEREPNIDTCSGLDIAVAPGAFSYVHVTDYDDDGGVPPYFLVIDFARCGDGVQEGLEQCDDGNNTAGDGCDAGCMTE